jgi:cell division protease FtsH
MAVVPMDGAGPLGWAGGWAGSRIHETSEATQRLVDEEVRRIIDSAHKDVDQLLRKHRHHLDSLADALLDQETLDEDDAYRAAGLPRNSETEPGLPSLS